MKKIFLGLMACAALCACTSDDLVSGVSTQKVFEGDVAYMTVSLKDVGSGTRATSPSENDGFGVATADEYAVNDAYFYFYDESGVHVSDAEVWNDGTANSTNTNIDFDGTTVIILKGLTGKSYPKYVVTVLNRPDGFTPGETLDEMATKLSETAALGITKSVTVSGTPTDYFVMSTSSYVANANGATDNRLAYFTTELEESDFFEEPVDMTVVIPVDIYVERLAAKIEVGVSNSLEPTELGDGEYGYPLTVTIAGDENADQQASGTTDVYIKIVGWNLNGTTKRSLMMKDITELDVATTGVGGWTQWNDATFFRSYWGKSYNYGLGSYPTTSGGATDGTLLDDYLDYVTYNELTLPVTSTETANNFTYCAENTNTADVLGSKYSTGITNVIIGAQICDAGGEALELIRYNGELFEEDAYLNYVMSYLSATGGLDVYTATTTGTETTYTHIDGSYIKVDDTTSSVDGSVDVVVNSEAFSSQETYYYFAEGTPTAYANAAAAIAAVTSALSTFNSTAGATIYANGMMYYNIPIEHLNNNYTGGVSLYEANYGIVRNHWYQLTINSFVDLGVGVYNPDEVIIPNENDDVLYYVGADLHILSWKLVEQGVDLK